MTTTNVNKRVLKDIFDGVTNLRREFGIYIAPETNMYLVHFILPGPEETPFEGGLYHGMIRLNTNHPLGAPNLYMYTPSGRFETEVHPIPATKRGICTTDTSFHPETWSPVKNIETVLKGFISLMCDKYDGAVGSVKSTDAQTRALAIASLTSIKNDTVVANLFPELHAQVANGTYTPVKLGELCNTTNTAVPVSMPVKEAKADVEPEPIKPKAKPALKVKTQAKTPAKTQAKVPTKPKTKRKVVFESSSESESSELESEEESVEESSEPELKPRKKSSKSKVSSKIPTKTKPPSKSKKEAKDTKGKSSTKAKTASKDKKAATKAKK